MTDMKKYLTVNTPAQELFSYSEADQSIGSRNVSPRVVDLIAERVSRVRISSGDRVAGSFDIFEHAGQRADRESSPSGAGRNLILDVNLGDDGNISLGIEDEKGLEGQDLSSLTSVETAAAPQRPQEHQEFPTRDFYSAKEAGEYLGVNKSTITRRVNANDLIGFTTFKKALCIPKAQFFRGDVLPGVKELLNEFDGNHRDAWYFLSSEIFYGDEDSTPLDKLRTAATERKTAECLEMLKTAKISHDFGDHF